MGAESIAIGIIRRPVGLQGFCGIESFGNTMGSFKAPCTLRIGRDEPSAVPMAITEIVYRSNGYQCRFEGRDDRTSVEGLRGFLIFADTKALPRLRGDTFYHFELKGMNVYEDVGGACIGKVVEVHNFPSLDTLEVQPEYGESLLLPLFDQAIVSIDKAGNRITARKSFIEELLQ